MTGRLRAGALAGLAACTVFAVACEPVDGSIAETAGAPRNATAVEPPRYGDRTSLMNAADAAVRTATGGPPDPGLTEHQGVRERAVCGSVQGRPFIYRERGGLMLAGSALPNGQVLDAATLELLIPSWCAADQRTASE